MSSRVVRNQPPGRRSRRGLAKAGVAPRATTAIGRAKRKARQPGAGRTSATRRSSTARGRTALARKAAGQPARRRGGFAWAKLNDEQLLELRFCDLGLRLEGTVLEARIARLYAELERHGIEFRPHFWLSDEWFSPDGVPGIAIPFYLAHPRLMRLEHKQMFEVEGGSEEWCMRILRHEAGHAIDTAYRLHFRRRWRETFGKYSATYPEFYQPKPYSRSYVLHLDMWYAQSHPAEDFAETFAVWLRPGSRWRTQYRGWPALKKLEYVDRLMAEVRQKRPLAVTRRHVAPLSQIRKTLRQHYAEKRAHYGADPPNFYDRELRRMFSDAPDCAENPSAAAFLREARCELRRTVAHWTGQYQYTIDQVLGEMIERAETLGLRLRRSPRHTKRDALVMVTVQVMNYLHGGRHRVAL